MNSKKTYRGFYILVIEGLHVNTYSFLVIQVQNKKNNNNNKTLPLAYLNGFSQLIFFQDPAHPDRQEKPNRKSNDHLVASTPLLWITIPE